MDVFVNKEGRLHKRTKHCYLTTISIDKFKYIYTFNAHVL